MKARTKMTIGDTIFDVMNVIFLAIVTLVCTFPLYFILINSISSSTYVEAQQVLFLPKGIQFDTYKKIFEINGISEAIRNSVMRTVLGTIFSVIGAVVVGYVISKKEFPHRVFWYRFMIVTMYFSAGVIPGYLNIKRLGLLNNFLVYILPGFVSAYNMILVKTYIEGLPEALEEAAMIDGAGYFQRFTKIILPLCKPIIATIAVFGAVGQWNSYMDTVLYMNGSHWPTLQSLLYQFLNQSNVFSRMMAQGNLDSIKQMASNISPATIRFAITGVTVIPILVVYPFFQRYFTKGIMIGAVKG